MCKGQVPSKRPPSGVEMRIEVHKVLAGERDADALLRLEPSFLWMYTVGWLPATSSQCGDVANNLRTQRATATE